MEAEAKEQVQIVEKEETGEECPSCGDTGNVRDYQQNTIICRNCGLVKKEEIKDRGPEWRAYNQKEKSERSRGGPPVTETIHDKGLSTQIDWRNKDIRGNSLSPDKRAQMSRLRKWHKSTKMSEQKNRNLSTALSEIERMSSQLGLPRNVRETAAKIYRKAVNEDLIRGHSIESVTSTVLYIACRKTQIPRTLDEIAEVSYIDEKEIAQNYRFITRELRIHLSPTNPAKYVARFGSELGISGEVQRKAIEIIKKAQKKKLTSGKGPAGTAAGALYVAGVMYGGRNTQKEVAEAAGVTEVTLRSRYKELVEGLNLDIS